ncbi:MAG: outer membrane beta-barrel protein, partial [Elusimicrobiaceae bacterium]|nr:outer membrane beta-barrel protein [Elusimicrobiaceae bacterium]
NNILLTGRFNVNPKEDLRVYIPFGLGVGITRISADVSVGGYSVKEKDRSTDFAWFFGLGLESKIEENTFLALEARFNQQRINLKDLDIKSSARYVNVLAKIGWKF